MAAQRFIYGERSFEITASTGVSELLDGGELRTALAEADLACKAAKDGGGARIKIYEQGDAQVQARHSEMRMASEIRTALDDNRLELFGQAICATNDPYGPASHYEVLLRMFDEHGAMVSPAIFIPVAERVGLISRIDRTVLANVLAILSDCNRHGGNARLTVNLSGTSLGDDEFREFARAAIRQAKIAEGSLNFEITETAAISNIGQAMSFIREMKDRGCDFLLDDFGAGMSSYSYLRQFPVDYVKIDGSFVKNIDNDEFDRSIVRSIHQICRAGNKRTVAEFVENEAILAVLQDIGVDYVQGYLLDKPSPLIAKLGALHAPHRATG
jgi:EAL domain-containing protein (putative c-di-GMP-specific phosphodiesterase class I)